MDDVDAVRVKYGKLRGVMDERVTRLWAAAEAEALGYRGIRAVIEATGISKARIRAGIRDLAEHEANPASTPARQAPAVGTRSNIASSHTSPRTGEAARS
jgi:hypothetical protein